MNGTVSQPVFCTACGEQLEDFCFSPGAGDLDALRAAAFRCYVEGRRGRGICAKLYIADNAHPAQPGEPTLAPAPLVDEEALRRAILAQIVKI
jgi:hypothetical protein